MLELLIHTASCVLMVLLVGLVKSVQVLLAGRGAGLGRRAIAARHHVLQYVNSCSLLHC